MAAGQAGNNNEDIRIGIIGYNEGNGHPYSFSAIVNGYDEEKMVEAFPVIASYLSKRTSSEFGINEARVTHVWTPDQERSRSIAMASLIDNIVDRYEELVEEVDAVIIARDDSESHHEIASFFLEHSIPTFVDKPLCTSLKELDYYKPYLENGLLMSCTGLRFYPAIRDRFNGELVPDEVLYASSHS